MDPYFDGYVYLGHAEQEVKVVAMAACCGLDDVEETSLLVERPDSRTETMDNGNPGLNKDDTYFYGTSLPLDHELVEHVVEVHRLSAAILATLALSPYCHRTPSVQRIQNGGHTTGLPKHLRQMSSADLAGSPAVV